MSSHIDHDQALRKLAHLSTLAEQLAPAFRDKFDFSEPKDFERWADKAFEGARALVAKQEALLAEEQKRYEDAQIAENKAAELAKAKEVAHV